MIRCFPAIACLLAAAAASGGESMKLDVKWRLQPAVSSSAQPDPKRWGSTESADWRWGVVDSKGTDWAKVDRKSVNSLWYEQSVKIPSEWGGRRLVLDFRRIEGDAIVFVNGQRAGELLRPGGEIEISSFAKPGSENLLRVFMTRDYTDISRSFEQDRLRYVCRTHEFGAIPMERWALGITAPVTLFARPKPAAIADQFVLTSFRDKELKFDVDLEATAPLKGLVLSAEVFDQDGKPALSFSSRPLDVAAGRSTASFSSKWESPRLWELDGGYLYTAKLKLSQDGKSLDEGSPLKFGFRELWSDGRKLMMNGHESRWRLVLHLFSGTNALHFMRLMGFNASYVQANPTMWWRDWSETPVFEEALLDEADKLGYAIMLPAPGVSVVREAINKDDALRKDFERETDIFLRRYRNHPSVMAWTVAMNSYNPRDAVSPQGMGCRYPAERVSSGQPKAILTACEIVKRRDPTRPAYAHADGNLGDIATSNMYLNFAQLQEREDWPAHWSKAGDMPYQMAEFGQPYTANFWKGKRFLPTEYLAMYFGPRAYETETERGLASLVDIGLANKSGHGSDLFGDGRFLDWNDYPSFWDFEALFTRNTNRAYRVWGVNCGWAYWLFAGYGDPPGFNAKQPNAGFKRYSPLKDDVSSRPSWANNNFDVFSLANKPLLAYVAGWPCHTDKTHSFFPGEKVEKSVAIVWDGPGSADLKLDWQVEGSALSGSEKISLSPGEIKQVPFSFKAPQVSSKTSYSISLKVSKDGVEQEGDRFAFSVIPRPAALSLKSNVALLDPSGRSASWLKGLGVSFAEFKEGMSLKGVDMLVLGRESLKAGDVLPYSPEDVKAGLKVLILEQRPEVWRGFGFRSNEAMPRRAFMGDLSSEAFAGLSQDDFVDWRGAPDLLPPGLNQPSDTLHAPKWTNAHALASSVPQVPRAAGFVPLASAEFDLDYSPLLEWRSGKGLVWLCSFDLSGRVGSDPAATLLASNILCGLDAAKPEPTRQLAFSGGKGFSAALNALCLDLRDWDKSMAPASTLLVVAPDSSLSPAEIEAFAAAGGRAFLISQSQERLAQFGLKAERVKTQRSPLPDSSDPLFRSLGQSLLRWREPIEIDAVGGSALAAKRVGSGVLLFCQADPSTLLATRQGDKEFAAAVETSVWRLQQLQARLLTNLGAEPSAASAARLCVLDLGPRYELLNHWNVLGPYYVDKEDGEAMLSAKFPGEEMAIAGDSNPNFTFKTSDGRSLDWRPTVKAGEGGDVNLAKVLKRESLSVAYVVTTLESSTERDAVLRVGFDWRARVWVNGEEVFKTLNGMNRAAAYSVKIHLKKGENSIGMKIGSGSKGHSFFADVSKETPAGAREISPELKAVSLYAGSSQADEFDPYEFHYW